jgi:hypothetical protein
MATSNQPGPNPVTACWAASCCAVAGMQGALAIAARGLIDGGSLAMRVVLVVEGIYRDVGQLVGSAT